MSTKVDKRILVNVPVSTAYNQWTQFEEFPHFMGGVKSIKQLTDDRLEWVAEIGGVERQWHARILEQVPDRKVSWAATEGATNAGAVTFEDAGGGQTSIRLVLEYEPEGLLEHLGDKLNVVERQAEADLKRFKEFIEDEGYATGAWRGTIKEGAQASTPGAEDAADRDRIAHPFDQTNALVDTEGDSNGTAASDTMSEAERRKAEERGLKPPGAIPPIGGSLGQH